MAFRKADESLICSEKTLTVSSNLHHYVQKQVQLLSLLSINKCIVFLFLNKCSAVIFFKFIFLGTIYIIKFFIYLFLRFFFLSFGVTNPDYRLVRVTSLQFNPD
jgi:hypothetical protein